MVVKRFLGASMAIGVSLMAGGIVYAADTPTFSRDVAPILFENCAVCHRPGEIAPMSLLSYQDARPWARAIRQKVAAREMPPWHADSPSGTFKNETRLTQPEIDTIVSWVDGGAPQGDPADMPTAPEFVEGWNIGTPDVVFSMLEEFHVPADGTVDYKRFVVPTNFTEDKWVQAAEARPGNRSVVHHMVVYTREPEPDPYYPGIQIKTASSRAAARRPASGADTGGPARQRRLLQGEILVATGVGTAAAEYLPGSAMLVKAGSRLIFEIHYTPSGTPATDLSSIGLVFSKQQPTHHVRTVPVWNTRFSIPAGAANHQVVAEADFTEDALIWTLFPHMHVRGKAFDYTLVYPDGRSEVILSVPKYDFDWQRDYFFKEPIPVPKGSRLICTAYFDNSWANRANPDPSADVRWGDQTWEEMMIGWTTYSVDGQTSPPTTAGQDASRLQ